MSDNQSVRNPGKQPKLLTTAFPETFFLQSCLPSLPKELLMHVARGESSISWDYLNKICSETHFTVNDILVAVRNECAILRKVRKYSQFAMSRKYFKLAKSRRYSQLAESIVEWIGPIHWKNVLESGCAEGMNTCPSCNTLIFKNGGCYDMRCVCGQYFYWNKNQLDINVLACACALVSKSAMILPQRILSAAERIVRSAYSAKQRRSKRPLLQIIEEDTMLTIDDVCFNDEDEGDDANFRMLCFDNNGEDKDDGFCDDPSLLYPRDLSLKDCDTPLSIERGYLALSDESSFVSITPSDLSLSDFIFVSDQDSVSPCSGEDDSTVVLCLPDGEETGNKEDESLFGLVSGCSMGQSSPESFLEVDSDEDDSLFSFVSNTGHSVDKINPCNARSEIARLSYCAAAKMGISASNDTASVATTNTNPNPFASSSSRNGPKHEKTPTEDNCYNEEATDIWEFLYEGSKLCRGGRRSLQFKGNPRSQKSACGWGTHRRPHWSRKRRKKYKTARVFIS